MAKAGGATDDMLDVIKERQFVQHALNDGFLRVTRPLTVVYCLPYHLSH